MIMDFEGVNPIINKNTYISESVDIVGKVKLRKMQIFGLGLGLEEMLTK